VPVIASQVPQMPQIPQVPQTSQFIEMPQRPHASPVPQAAQVAKALQNAITLASTPEQSKPNWHDRTGQPEADLPVKAVGLQSKRGKSSLALPVAAGRVPQLDSEGIERLQEQLKGKPKEVLAALQSLQGRVWDLSCRPHGCRLIQLALEQANQTMAAYLAAELHGCVLDAMLSPHANYVVQKLVTQLTWSACSFVAEELRGTASKLSRHRFGCRIFCRLLEFHGKHHSVQLLVEEVLNEAEDLCCHPFGHHVAQSVLEHGTAEHRDVVAATIESNPLGFAKNQNASYLVERVLSSCSDWHQDNLLCTLFSSLADLALSRYGCYVARAVVEHPKTDRPAAMAKICGCQKELSKTKHGQHLMLGLGFDRTCFHTRKRGA